jgi:hypothetical protein
MPILFDYDADTGVKTMFDYDPINDQVLMTYEQDVTGFLDRMQTVRNNPEISSKGIKEDWWHYCSIPPVVEMELMKKDLYLHRPDDMKAILKIINSDYPYLRATDKWHR